jgi:hypothetical protein
MGVFQNFALRDVGADLPLPAERDANISNLPVCEVSSLLCEASSPHTITLSPPGDEI